MHLNWICKSLNTWIYNLGSGPHIICFSAIVLRNGKISSKSLFWNKQKQCADSRWKQQSYFTSISINFSIFKLVVYFSSIIISQIKYYLVINRGSFLQIQCYFYRHALEIHCHLLTYDGVLLKKYIPRTKGSYGTWLFRASWWKVIKDLFLYEIDLVSFVVVFFVYFFVVFF